MQIFHNPGKEKEYKQTMTSIALECSTDRCTAALLKDGVVIAEKINVATTNHAGVMPVFAQELIAESQETKAAVEAIVLSEGPGSYTGLRIGASLAKGLCYGMDIPLIAVPTLAVIAQAAIRTQQSEVSKQALYCPMIDARRMEVYCALYDADLNIVQPLEAKVVDEHSWQEVLDEHIIYFCGNGADKCKAVISHPNARWIDGIAPSAAEAGRLAERTEVRGQIRVIEGKEIAYFEPNYLKEFIAAPAHIKGLFSAHS